VNGTPVKDQPIENIENLIRYSDTVLQVCIETFKQAIAKIHTGRAHPGLLGGVVIDYYGASTPLQQLANVVAEDSRTFAIMVYDRHAISAIEKAIPSL
jgi:ribosome recycling factor